MARIHSLFFRLFDIFENYFLITQFHSFLHFWVVEVQNLLLILWEHRRWIIRHLVLGLCTCSLLTLYEEVSAPDQAQLLNSHRTHLSFVSQTDWESSYYSRLHSNRWCCIEMPERGRSAEVLFYHRTETYNRNPRKIIARKLIHRWEARFHHPLRHGNSSDF